MGEVRGLKAATGRVAAWAGSLIVGLFFFWSPSPGLADSVTGHVDLIWSKLNTSTQDATGGNQTNTESRSFYELYTLAADKYLLPNLKLYGSGVFQQNATDTITNGERTTTTTVLTRPYLELTLRSQPFSGGVNYSKVETRTRTPGSPRDPFINEVYSGFFGWKPSELPTLDIRVVQSKNYDQNHVLFDTDNKTVSVNSDYAPTKTVHLRYYGSYVDQKDLLQNVETKTYGHDGRVDYGDLFLDNRLSVNVSEDYTYSTIKTISSGQGNVTLQVFAIQGLALNTFDVQGLSGVPLAAAPFLIDGVLNQPRTASNNIGSSLFPQDTTPRNIGLQFAVPSEVNTIDVFVYSVHDTSNPDTTQDFLTPAVAAAYIWSVYTSSDGKSWSLFLSGVPAAYTPFAAQLGVGKFELTFPTVTTKYIKVVVTPLLPSAAGNTGRDFPGVYLTELQALISVAAASVEGERTAKSLTSNLATRYRIVEKPYYLSYDFSYFEVQSDSITGTTRSSTMSNGLSYSQVYNYVFSGNAGAQRIDENGSEPNSRRTTYQANVSLQANPLPTLHHSISYGYQDTEQGNQSSSANSVYVTNTADLYKGVSVYVNGGESWGIDINNVRSRTFQSAYGITLIPLKTLTLSASSTYTRTDSTSVYYSRSDTLGVAYSPFPTMFMNASWTTLDETNHHDRLQNYNVSWSPFPGGNLIVNIAYLESLTLQNNAVSKSLQESVRWNINPRMYTQISYADGTNNSDLQGGSFRVLSAELNIAL